MLIFLIIPAVILWGVLGYSGMAYWWRHEFGDLDFAPFPLGVVAGPFAWPLGYLIHGRG